MNGEGNVIHPHKGRLSNLNKEGSLAPATTGMNPEDIMPQEMSQSQKHKHQTIPLT